MDRDSFHSVNYARTQAIGAAVAFLECDGLITPSARWPCENLILFLDNHALSKELSVVATQEVDWRSWARQHGRLKPDPNGVRRHRVRPPRRVDPER